MRKLLSNSSQPNAGIDNLDSVRIMLMTIAIMSFVSLMLVYYQIDSVRKSQNYLKLIKAIAIVQTTYIWSALMKSNQFTVPWMMCYLNTPEFMTDSTGHFLIPNQFRAMTVVTFINQFIYYTTASISFILQVCLCHELVISLKNPFAGSGIRFYIQVIMAAIISFFINILIWATDPKVINSIFETISGPRT